MYINRIKNVPKYRDAAKIELEVLRVLNNGDPDGRNRCVNLRDDFDFRGHICTYTHTYTYTYTYHETCQLEKSIGTRRQFFCVSTTCAKAYSYISFFFFSF